MTRGDRVLRVFASAPRFERFYSLFERAGANVEQATAMLAELIRRSPDDGARLRFELKELETHGDRITHDVIQHLNVKAATPFAVSTRRLDRPRRRRRPAEEVADFMGLYRIEAATEQARALASVLEQAGASSRGGAPRLRRPVDLPPQCRALRARTRCDGSSAMPSAAVDGSIDPMVAIRGGHLRAARGRHRRFPPRWQHARRRDRQEHIAASAQRSIPELAKGQGARLEQVLCALPVAGRAAGEQHAGVLVLRVG